MARVRNWQLGRDMDYPYAAARPKRQFTMIMDTNKYIACQSCTIACKSTWTWGKARSSCSGTTSRRSPSASTRWAGTSTSRAPRRAAVGGGTYTGETIFEAAPPGERVLGWTPSEEDWSHPNIGEDEPTGNAEETTYIPAGGRHSMMWMYYLQRICNHCTYPACVAAARARRSTSGRRTGSCSSTRSAAGATRSASACRTRRRCSTSRRASPRSASAATRSSSRAADPVHDGLHRPPAPDELPLRARRRRPAQAGGLPRPRPQDRAAAVPAAGPRGRTSTTSRPSTSPRGT